MEKDYSLTFNMFSQLASITEKEGIGDVGSLVTTGKQVCVISGVVLAILVLTTWALAKIISIPFEGTAVKQSKSVERSASDAAVIYKTELLGGSTQ